MKGEWQAKQRCQQRPEALRLPLARLPTSRLSPLTSTHPRPGTFSTRKPFPCHSWLGVQAASRRWGVKQRRDPWATPSPEPCPALSLIGDCAHAVPSTCNAPSFLLLSVHIPASLQGQGKCHLLHKAFLDSTLSLHTCPSAELSPVVCVLFWHRPRRGGCALRARVL